MWICLIASAIFWLNLYWALLAPPSPLSMQALIATTVGLIYAVVLPALWSILIPGTPAGMLLQSTKLRTWGFAFVIAASGYLAYHAATLLRAWWAAQQGIVATGQVMSMTIACLIAFIGIPALSWVQASPDQWMEQIRQAHLVTKLKQQYHYDLMSAKEQYMRAILLLRRGLANLTASECNEVAGTLIALQRAENETLESIAGTLGALTGFDTGVQLISDERIVAQYDRLAEQLRRNALPINQDYVELPAPSPRAGTEGATDRASERAYQDYSAEDERDEPSPRNDLARSDAPSTRVNNAIIDRDGPRRAATGRRPDAHTAALGVTAACTVDDDQEPGPYPPTSETWGMCAYARQELPEVWTVRALAELLNVSESRAREFKNQWVDEGWVTGKNLPNGRYRYTERG